MMSMRHGHTLPVLELVLCLVLSGCVGPSRPIQDVSYYTFSYDPPQSARDKHLAVVLQIDNFTAAPLYNTERIVYQSGPYKRNVYHYHRWQSNPADLVTYYLARDLKASGRFAAVLTETGRLLATHFVTGTVDEIFENDTTNGWQAVIAITVQLSKAGENQADKAILFQKSYRGSELSASRSPSAVVAAMSTAMAAVSKAVLADVFAALSDTEADLGQ